MLEHGGRQRRRDSAAAPSSSAGPMIAGIRAARSSASSPGQLWLSIRSPSRPRTTAASTPSRCRIAATRSRMLGMPAPPESGAKLRVEVSRSQARTSLEFDRARAPILLMTAPVTSRLTASCCRPACRASPSLPSRSLAVACGDLTRPKATTPNLAAQLLGLRAHRRAGRRRRTRSTSSPAPARADAASHFDVAFDLDAAGKIRRRIPCAPLAGALAGTDPDARRPADGARAPSSPARGARARLRHARACRRSRRARSSPSSCVDQTSPAAAPTRSADRRSTPSSSSTASTPSTPHCTSARSSTRTAATARSSPDSIPDVLMHDLDWFASASTICARRCGGARRSTRSARSSIAARGSSASGAC